MNRREFLAGSTVAGLAAALPAAGDACKPCCSGMPKLTPPAKPAQLNLCLQWGLIPTKDDINAKLDYLEQNDFQAVEITSKLEWLRDQGPKLVDALKGRKLFLTTACGPSRFDYADKSKNDAEVERFTPVLEILGQMKSIGLIIEQTLGVKPEIGAQRIGEVPGTHTAEFLSEVDKLTFTHEAFSRQGFAEGAVVAALMTEGLTGCHEFKDLIL